MTIYHSDMKVEDKVTLLQEIRSFQKGVVYAPAGEQVVIIDIRENVLLVETKNGKRFSVHKSKIG